MHRFSRTTWLLLVLMLLPLAGYGQGGSIIFASEFAGRSDIFTIKLDGSDRQQLIADGSDPAVSPDGTQLAFVRGNDIYLAHIDGSGAHPVTSHGLGIFVQHPSFSPDGMRIVFAMGIGTPNSVMDIRVLDIGNIYANTLAKNGYDPIYAPDGMEAVFARDGDLYTVFAGFMSGYPYTPLPVLRHGPGAVLRGPAYSPDGAWLAFSLITPMRPTRDIYLLNYTVGRHEFMLVADGSQPAFSPDGDYIVFVRNGDLYLIEINGSNLLQLTNGPATDSRPSWIP
ncbi:MAG: TolB family protein [Armatimonadota bacterium]